MVCLKQSLGKTAAVELRQFLEMRMEDPRPTFSYLVEEIVKRHPDFAFIHLVEPRVEGNVDREVQAGEVSVLEA